MQQQQQQNASIPVSVARRQSRLGPVSAVVALSAVPPECSGADGPRYLSPVPEKE